MADTTELTIKCDECVIQSQRSSSLEIKVEYPDIPHLLGQITNEDLIDFMQREFTPDEIFTTDSLEKWAESEGYTKEQ